MNFKSVLFIFLFSVVLLRVPAPASATPTEEPLELQLMLADKVISLPLPPYCGILMTDVVVRFKVIKVLKGFYLKKDILIHIKCLREAVEGGSIGDHATYVYKLKKLPLAPGDTNEDHATYNIVYF